MNTPMLFLGIVACAFPGTSHHPVDLTLPAMEVRAERILPKRPPPRGIIVCHFDYDLVFDPRAAVQGALQALESRSAIGYLSWLSPDFRYDSDDPQFRAQFPRGMSLDDEVVFVARLLGERKHRARAGPPRAIDVSVTYRSLDIGAATDSSASVVVMGLRCVLTLEDSTRIDTGEAQHRMEVVLRGEGWRVRRWVESVPQSIAQASPAVADSTTAADSTAAADSVASAMAELPLHLAMTAYLTTGGSVLRLDLALPRSGATFELFDVQGRRVARTDLGDLKPGVRHVSLLAAGYAAGVYWARVRLGDETVTSRVIVLK